MTSDVVRNLAALGPAEETPLLSHYFNDDECVEGAGPWQESDGTEVVGWVTAKWARAGLHSRLVARVLVQGARKVYLINVSEYASVGEQDWVVFGDRLEDIQAFLKSIGRLKLPVEEIEAVSYSS